MMKTQQHASPGNMEHNQATARSYRVRSWNRRTQTRFISRRRAYWLARCPAEPTPRQVTLAESIAQLEWAGEVARYENTLTSLRDLREHLRLRDRLVGDLSKSIAAPPERRLSMRERLLSERAAREAEAA
jgi:hypothetical protein